MLLPKRNWTDEVYNFLVSQKEDNRVIAFDFDNTLVKNDFGEAVMEYILYTGMPKFKENFSEHFSDSFEAEKIWKDRKNSPSILRDFAIKEYESIIQSEGLEKAYRWTSFIFSGYSPSELRSAARTVWENDKNISPYEEMRDVIRFFKKLNKEIFIVTASPTCVIQEVANEFFVDEKKVIGMNARLKDGIFTSEIVEPYTYGEGKVKALGEIVKNIPSIAFGDSENDFYLLKNSETGIFIDRGNEKIKSKFQNIGSLIQPVFR